jgi:adenylate kinase family enzyme
MKIFLFWTSGCGKTTIWRKIAKEQNIPFFELDKILWDFTKNEPIIDKEKRKRIITALVKNNKQWVIEWLYREACLNQTISDSDYIFILDKNKILIDIQITHRMLKRIFWFEKNERESSLKVLIKFIKWNHSQQFHEVYLKELNQKLLKLNKKAIFVKNIKGIKKHID